MGAKELYQLKNYMEDVVKKLVEKLMQEESICSCNKCQLDVMALALNDCRRLILLQRRANCLRQSNQFIFKTK